MDRPVQEPIRSALLVTQHYWPEPIGSAPYVQDVAEYLACQGTDVTVFTCRPFYPQGFVHLSYRSGLRDCEQHGGIRIERVAPFRPHRGGALDRIAREMLFFMQGILALATRRIRRSPVVISLCPSIFGVLLGSFLRQRNGRHVVLVHDIQSGLASGLGILGGSRLSTLMQWFERLVLNRSDIVLVLSSMMEGRLRNQGVRTAIEILPIWVDTNSIRPGRAPRGKNVTAVYSGNLGRKQGLEQVVAMAEQLARRGNTVECLLRGDGGEAPRIAAEIKARNLSNVKMARLVPQDQLSESLAQGAIHLVPQNPRAADFAVPSKAFTIMASGRPFVATANPGSQLWDLQAKSAAFLCVPADDAGAFADAVHRLASNPLLRVTMGRNGRRYARRNHDKALLLGRLAAIAAARPNETTWNLTPSRIS